MKQHKFKFCNKLEIHESLDMNNHCHLPSTNMGVCWPESTPALPFGFLNHGNTDNGTWVSPLLWGCPTHCKVC